MAGIPLVNQSVTARRQACLELDGWSIRERRVKPVAIIDLFDEVTDRAAGVLDVAVAARLNLFVLERLHEALRLGIVVGVADTAHAGAMPCAASTAL